MPTQNCHDGEYIQKDNVKVKATADYGSGSMSTTHILNGRLLTLENRLEAIEHRLGNRLEAIERKQDQLLHSSATILNLIEHSLEKTKINHAVPKKELSNSAPYFNGSDDSMAGSDSDNALTLESNISGSKAGECHGAAAPITAQSEVVEDMIVPEVVRPVHLTMQQEIQEASLDSTTSDCGDTYGMEDVEAMLSNDRFKEETERYTELIVKNRVKLVEQLDLSCVRHVFTQPYLAQYCTTTRELLDRLGRYRQRDLHRLLWQCVAGIAPELFREVFGRHPVTDEREFITQEFTESLKRALRQQNALTHTDKVGDRSIQLDTDYVQLRLFGRNSSKGRDSNSHRKRKPTWRRQQSPTSDCSSGSEDDSSSPSSSETETEMESAREQLLSEEADWELPYLHQGRDDREERRGPRRHCEISPLEVLAESEEDLPGHRPNKSGTMTLVKGRPGVGKTTTVQWLHRQWALGRFVGDFSVFFVLHIRHLIHVRDQEMTLCRLLGRYCRAAHQAGGLPNYMAAWMTHNQESILLAIDGIDEMPDFADCFNFPSHVTSATQLAPPFHLVASILKRTLLPSAKVIILSRGFTMLKEIPIDRLVEIRGLSQAGVLQFVHRFAPHDSVADIQSLLGRNPLLMSVCSVTVYCMLICSALSDDVTRRLISQQELLTYTRIYSFIILHYLRRSDAPDGYRDVHSVGLRYSTLLTTLGRLACTSFSTRPVKMVFNETDLQLAAVNLQEVTRTGLLSVDTEADFTDHHAKQKYIIASFLHLSVQEFLATSAMVAQMKSSDLQLFITSELVRGQFEMALLFCYGHVFDRNSENVRQIHDAMEKGTNAISRDSLLSPTVEWQAKEEVLCNILQSILESMSESEDYVRLAVLVHESQSPKLAAQCARAMSHESTLEFSNSPMTVVDMMSVMFVVRHARNLKRLSIQCCMVDAASVKYMEEMFKGCSTLKVLDLQENEIGDDGATELCRILKANTSLHSLCLSDNGIGDAGMMALVDYISTSSTLRHLFIAQNRFGDECLSTLLKVITTKRSFKTLDIGNNRFITATSNRQLTNFRNAMPQNFTLKYEGLPWYERYKEGVSQGWY